MAVDRAKVNPEPPAGRPEAAPAAGVRAIAHHVASTVGRVVEQLSRLYGYAIIIAAFNGTVLSGISSLPFTKWDDDGVPRADALIVSGFLGVWMSLCWGVSQSVEKSERRHRDKHRDLYTRTTSFYPRTCSVRPRIQHRKHRSGHRPGRSALL